MERAQRHGRRARARGDRRRHLDHRNRRTDARRRPRLADGEVRPRRRQRPRHRASNRRRRDARRERRVPSRPVLGSTRRRRQLRRGDDVHVRASSARVGHGRPDRTSHRCSSRDASFLPGPARGLPRRPHGVCGARPRARRLGPEALRHDRLPHGLARAGRERSRPVQGMGVTSNGRGGADAVPRHEHAPRRGLPRWPAELLALELHGRTSGRAHRHGRGALRVRPIADVGHRVRALSRSGDPCRRHRDRGPAPAGRLEHAPSLDLVRSCGR